MTEFIVAASFLKFTPERMKVSKGETTLRSCWCGQGVVGVGVSRALVSPTPGTMVPPIVTCGSVSFRLSHLVSNSKQSTAMLLSHSRR